MIRKGILFFLLLLTSAYLFAQSQLLVDSLQVELEDAEDEIEEAAEGCPVGTIAIEYDNSGKRDNIYD